MKKNAELNKNVDLNMPESQIPRTKLIPDSETKTQPIAECNPAQFAQQLCEKLERLQLSLSNDVNKHVTSIVNKPPQQPQAPQQQQQQQQQHQQSMDIIDQDRFLDQHIEHIDREYSGYNSTGAPIDLNSQQQHQQHCVGGFYPTPLKSSSHQLQQSQLKRKPILSKSGTELQYLNNSSHLALPSNQQPQLNSTMNTTLSMSYLNATKLLNNSANLNSTTSQQQQQQQQQHHHNNNSLNVNKSINSNSIFQIATQNSCKEVDIDENSSVYNKHRCIVNLGAGGANGSGMSRSSHNHSHHSNKNGGGIGTNGVGGSTHKSSTNDNYDSGVSLISYASIERVSDWLQTSSGAGHAYHQPQQLPVQQQPHHHHHQHQQQSQPNLQPTPTLQIPPQPVVQPQSVNSKLDQSLIKTTVAYYLPGEELAYISTFNGSNITLSQFKQLITKKGAFR